MAIYINSNNETILPISDEEFAELGWSESNLLELEHDDYGWTIKRSRVAASKYTRDEHKENPLRGPLARRPTLVGRPSKT